jgi:hypothetical protein
VQAARSGADVRFPGDGDAHHEVLGAGGPLGEGEALLDAAGTVLQPLDGRAARDGERAVGRSDARGAAVQAHGAARDAGRREAERRADGDAAPRAERG